MKPSERIEEIHKELNDRNSPRYSNNDYSFARAITDYLDEEYEKNKPCEHDWRAVDISDIDYCKKCKILSV